MSDLFLKWNDILRHFQGKLLRYNTNKVFNRNPRLRFFKEKPNTGVKAESPFVFVYLLILFTYGCCE